jgi:hypothetical protein
LLQRNAIDILVKPKVQKKKRKKDGSLKMMSLLITWSPARTLSEGFRRLRFLEKPKHPRKQPITSYNSPDLSSERVRSSVVQRGIMI